MRDGEIIRREQKTKAKLQLLYQQFEFIETRQRALETVMQARLGSDVDLKKLVDDEHMKLVQQARMQMEAMVKEQRKPKLTIVGAEGMPN